MITPAGWKALSVASAPPCGITPATRSNARISAVPLECEIRPASESRRAMAITGACSPLSWWTIPESPASVDREYQVDSKPPTTSRLVRRHARLSALVYFLLFASLTLPHLRAEESFEPAPLAAHALLLDAVNTGDKIVAVGDHGIVVISRDNGLTWTQSITPTRALLTAVSFPDAQHGWAVGHDGIILASNDGGQTWQRQDSGNDRESVLLDVRFLDPTHGFAVGAYGKFVTTNDGGKTWSAAQPSPEETHYNRLSAGDDGYLYLAGESGTLLVSADSGKTWHKAEVPYDGSLFGTLPLAHDSLVIYGLRGHILRSEDHGLSWESLHSETKVLITCGLRLKTGTILLGGQSGNFFVSHDTGRTFSPWKPADFGTSIAGMVEANDGAIVTVGEAGAVRVKLP